MRRAYGPPAVYAASIALSVVCWWWPLGRPVWLAVLWAAWSIVPVVTTARLLERNGELRAVLYATERDRDELARRLRSVRVVKGG